MSRYMSSLVCLEKVGEGTYGVVYKCLDQKSGQLKALKKIKFDNSPKGVPSSALREIGLLRELSHPNIVTLEHVYLKGDRLYLFFEYLNVDLRKYMDLNYKGTGLPPGTAKSFMYQMLQALQYCHVRRIIHRDLKPQNVLVDVDKGVVKLADFGLARSFSYPLCVLTHEVVTLLYRAPEILLGETIYCCGVDMWSMGCILAEIVTGDPLFHGDSEIDQLFHIFQMKGMPTEETWPGVTKLPNFNPSLFPAWHTNRLCSQAKIARALDADGLDLLTALLRYDPLSRMTAQQALLHPYFADLDKKSLPAAGEEYVGLEVDKIPPDYRELFEALINLDVSDLRGDDEKEMREAERTSDNMLRMVPSSMLLGASTYQVSAVRDRFAKEKEKKSEAEKSPNPSESRKRVAKPLAENRNINNSAT